MHGTASLLWDPAAFEEQLFPGIIPLVPSVLKNGNPTANPLGLIQIRDGKQGAVIGQWLQVGN